MFIKPMLARPDVPVSLDDSNFVFEQKFDGIRAIVDADPGGVHIFSRLGHDKTDSFPEIARSARYYAQQMRSRITLDGEIIAVGVNGAHDDFQKLQHRIHVKNDVEAALAKQPVAFVAFDLLHSMGELRTRFSWAVRRLALNNMAKLFGWQFNQDPIRISQYALAGEDARALYAKAQQEAWEGVIAKRIQSTYQIGKRSADWVKVKFKRRQEFVVGGWTDPQNSRQHFGALMVGVYEDGQLRYCGNVGTGFEETDLRLVAETLRDMPAPQCPFAPKPKVKGKPHWVEPRALVEVEFSSVTDDGKLRWPSYKGLRFDKDPRTVCKEW